MHLAAIDNSPRELRANLGPLLLLAVGLVLTTAGAVAAAAHLLAVLSWPAAFVLGAVVSPTDPLAATATFARLGVPARVASVVEGESLINDATALVAYSVALGAVATGGFSVSEAALEFLVSGAGVVAVGLALGWLLLRLALRLGDPVSEISISVFLPFAAYLGAEEMGVSGVLAVVAGGLYLGWSNPSLGTGTRLQGFAFWRVLVFVLNVLLFVLVGIQFPRVLEGVGAELPSAELAALGLVVVAVVVAVRLLWQFLSPDLARLLGTGSRTSSRLLRTWRERLVVGWSGMRGAVSLAAALALPPRLGDGPAVAERDLIVFLTFSVILGTLVAQGLTLPPLIRALGLRSGGTPDPEEASARLEPAQAALSRLDELASEGAHRGAVERARGLYERRAGRHREALGYGGRKGPREEEEEAYRNLRRELISAERRELVGMRDAGKIKTEAMRRIERDLDLEEERLGA